MGKRRRGNQEITNLTKKQKKHLKEFGEQHPFHDNVVDRPEKTQILRLPDSPQHPEHDSKEDSDEEQLSAYQKLLTTMIQGADDNSEDEESDGEDDGEEVEGESEEEEEEEEEEGNDAEEDLEEEEGGTPDNSQNKEHPEKTKGDIEENEKVETEGEFTDKKNEAAFCLETNLPAEGEENMGAQEEEDVFAKHQETELSEEEVGQILQGSKIKSQVKWPKLGTLQCMCPSEHFPAVGQPSSAPLPTIHKTLEANWCLLNQSFAPEGGAVTDVTELQKELLGLMGTYRDVHFTNSSPLREAKEVRSAYCLHVLNHVLKANTRVLRNNAKLKETKDVNEEFRDQGITRPKVLILVPFRDGVLRVVQTFITLLEPKGKKMDVSNKKRFKEEYGEEPGESPPKLHRPDDYHAVFSGNTDDHFRIVLSFRFQFFVDKILPQYRDSVMSHTFIYVPSYFDFVRLRNYLKKEDVSFASVSEYSQRSEVSRARHYFQKGEKQFMLFSERFHFYK
ncbi:digestive organ expansion factor-like, partial [Sinocyclocheilus grahami]|uniref:digestive organ expansion factor-like n=1 Tax=Sinocyclocheilus grahami TaxID=75366 RepID=UPI0007AD3DF0